jgi:3-deoxy-D-manno-octulosonate 8-phosphate phosphatase (KDO 8-P phosphatase)
MRAVGLAVCPADAVNKIKLIAHLILTRKGGEGCIRELVDEYLLNEFHP